MAKAKVSKKSTSIDMTPMVDLAFLLITFFMLTIQFRPPETVKVSTPSSVADKEPSKKNMITITIDPKGRIFFNISNDDERTELLKSVAGSLQASFTEKQFEEFKSVNDVGLPIAELKKYLDTPYAVRITESDKLPGLPTDTTGGKKNELGTWLFHARINRAKIDMEHPYDILIKSDAETPYPVIRTVIETLKKQKANRFKLLTKKESL